jgi:hypothetical protein
VTRRLEELRKAAEDRKAEDARKAAETRRAAEARKAEEEERRLIEARRAQKAKEDEAKRVAEAKAKAKANEEERRRTAEAKKSEPPAKLAQGPAPEARKAAPETKKTAEPPARKGAQAQGQGDPKKAPAAEPKAEGPPAAPPAARSAPKAGKAKRTSRRGFRGRRRPACENPGSDVALPGWYVVKSGDTLWAIAQRHYGAGWRYKRIFAANRRRMASAHRIWPCQRVYLPPAPGVRRARAGRSDQRATISTASTVTSTVFSRYAGRTVMVPGRSGSSAPLRTSPVTSMERVTSPTS